MQKPNCEIARNLSLSIPFKGSFKRTLWFDQLPGSSEKFKLSNFEKIRVICKNKYDIDCSNSYIVKSFITPFINFTLTRNK